jgi:DNA-directed RNA polymerase subunit RPC12/RpoP
MADDKISVSFKCERCGTRIAWDDDTVTDSTEIFCTNCGDSAGTYGDLRNAAMEAAKAKAEDMIRDITKRR